MVTEELSSTSLEVQGWRELHRAAIYEADPQQLASRINKAEKALAHRSRELFVTPGNHLQERKAIDRALYTLRTLSFCLRLKATTF